MIFTAPDDGVAEACGPLFAKTAVMLLIERIFLQDYGRNRFQYRRLNYTIAQHFVSMSHRDKQIINLNYLEYHLQYHGYCSQ